MLNKHLTSLLQFINNNSRKYEYSLQQLIIKNINNYNR